MISHCTGNSSFSNRFCKLRYFNFRYILNVLPYLLTVVFFSLSRYPPFVKPWPWAEYLPKEQARKPSLLLFSCLLNFSISCFILTEVIL
ncbi:hypothetical protein CW304_17710 [Bacillus sp. UFRGS-B20]|nr:hypothetical protein CW304_17710 [Bacillus sp. UFRGS-B20]